MTHNPYSPPNAEVADIRENAGGATAANLSRYDFGGFWLRVLACLIDAIILIPLQLALEYILLGSIDPGPTTLRQVLWPTVISVGLWCVYCTACWSSPWQATPGKLACGLRVTTVDLKRLSVLHAFGRYWAYVVSGTIVIGILFIPFTERRQALHDLMARTVVPKRDALRRVGK